MDKMEVGQIIQLSLTPGIMISSSALFSLGLQTRFSNLFGRFRLLNQERRTLEQVPSRTPQQNERLQNLIQQLDRLMKRTHAVKNAILFFYSGILCFISTALLLFFAHSTGFISAQIGLFAFFAGMLSIFTACLFMIQEIAIAFHILKLERGS